MKRKYFCASCVGVLVLGVGVSLLLQGGGDSALAQADVIAGSSDPGPSMSGGRQVSMPQYSNLHLQQRSSVMQVRVAEAGSRSGNAPREDVSGKDFDPRSLGSRMRVRAGQGYDSQVFRQQPDAYLSQVDPGRINDTLPYPQHEGDLSGVVHLKAVGGRLVDVERGASSLLRVQTAPGAAATFVSYDGGVFGNGLACISVQADEGGVAEASYYINAGMESSGAVLSASPEAVGVVSFVVTVTE